MTPCTGTYTAHEKSSRSQGSRPTSSYWFEPESRLTSKLPAETPAPLEGLLKKSVAHEVWLKEVIARSPGFAGRRGDLLYQLPLRLPRSLRSLAMTCSLRHAVGAVQGHIPCGFHEQPFFNNRLCGVDSPNHRGSRSVCLQHHTFGASGRHIWSTYYQLLLRLTAAIHASS